MLAYARQNQAAGQIFIAQGLAKVSHIEIIARFNAARNREYSKLLEQSESFTANIDREALHQDYSFAQLEDSERSFVCLRKSIGKVRKRDFFKTERCHAAVTAIINCRKQHVNYTSQVYSIKDSLFLSTRIIYPAMTKRWNRDTR